MNLISTNETINLLPGDGVVNYYGTIITQQEATHYLHLLLKNIQWQHDEAFIFGRHIITKRKVAWYADNEFSYTYSNITRQALPWTEELTKLKRLTEKITGTKFNSCLLNLYHTGEEGMAWHSDDEKTLEKNSSIASLSFGAERKFSLKNKKTKAVVSAILENGSLLVMKDATQDNWLHCLPKSKKIKTARINLTFRKMAT